MPQKRVRIRHVQQEHKSGCLVACIAMVLGWEYDDVVTHFKNDFDRCGIDGELAKEFICEHRYSVIEKRGSHYGDVKEHNKRMLEPFAPVHIVSVQQFKDSGKISHALVMDSKGNVLDPHDPGIKEVECYEVLHIMGFWKD